MSKRPTLVSAGLLLALVVTAACTTPPSPPAAVARESGVIESRVGFVDEISGARVEAVEPHGKEGVRVLVSLPARGDEPAIEIEEVLVTAPRVVPQAPIDPPRYEFVQDYANDRYGFYIYLGGRKDLPFRLYFKDHSAGSIQNTQP